MHFYLTLYHVELVRWPVSLSAEYISTIVLWFLVQKLSGYKLVQLRHVQFYLLNQAQLPFYWTTHNSSWELWLLPSLGQCDQWRTFSHLSVARCSHLRTGDCF